MTHDCKIRLFLSFGLQIRNNNRIANPKQQQNCKSETTIEEGVSKQKLGE